MVFLFIIVLIGGAVCGGLVSGEVRGDTLDKNNKKFMYGCVSLQIIMGVLVCWLVDFNIELYGENKRDFYDRGKINAEGVTYFLVWFAGASHIVSGIINLVRLAVLELKTGFADALSKSQGSGIGGTASSSMGRRYSGSVENAMDHEYCQKYGTGENVRREATRIETPKETVIVTAGEDFITCPQCGAVQKKNRTCCFECGVRFDVQQ